MATTSLPILPLRDTVVFPDAMTPLLVAQPRSVRLIEHVVRGDDRLVLATVREGVADEPGPGDVYTVATEAVVHRVIRVPDGTFRVLVQGVQRVKLTNVADSGEFLTGNVRHLADTVTTAPKEIEALVREVLRAFHEAIELSPSLPDELAIVAENLDDAGELCHLVASTLRMSTTDRQKVLEKREIGARLRMVLTIAGNELDVLRLGSKIHSEVHGEMSRSQRDWFLRQQLKQIQEELGEGEGDELRELRDRIAALALPEAARMQAERELSRLARTPEQSAEHGVIRTYLEWIAALPWSTYSDDVIDLEHAREVLDTDHHDLDEVKDRILDFLAVSRLKRDMSGPIICFVGPPGVGKTSLGRSIARAVGRSFVRVSVGGVRDESEIRGHRRTYIGAMPGTIVRSLRDAGTANPVFMIDEIDKLGSDWRGDPSSAMLEVLDPEQNSSFRDHYLDLPFDLSRVLFICTANRLDTIPAALRDRMEIIPIEGYTEEDKLEIARRYLVPRQRKAHGLKARQFSVTKPALQEVVRSYTREAGVRELDRRIAGLARKAARRVAEQADAAVKVTPELVSSMLGRRRFDAVEARRIDSAGVATGLAVTSTGGDVLYVEARAVPGKGRLTITGQLGKVMEESAHAALTWVRGAVATRDGEQASEQWFARHDLHVHVPAGAIPKDGPSAGIAMASALASLYLGVPLRHDVALTGEITLTGEVLPIGGVKDKALAAQRAGVAHVIVPERNEPDLADLPQALVDGVTFHLVDEMDQVLDIVFPDRDWVRQRAGRRRAEGAGGSALPPLPDIVVGGTAAKQGARGRARVQRGPRGRSIRRTRNV